MIIKIESMTEKILEVENLKKSYGEVTAVDGVSFSVSEGEIVGLLGPNGAGKTTTIDMILGLVEPSAGIVRIFGKNFDQHRREILALVNFAAVYAALPSNLTVGENLYMFGLLYGVAHPRERARELAEEFDLAKFFHTKAGLLSSGEQSRLHLAKSLLNRPRLLLMDEPTASLDPSAAEIMRERIRQYMRETRAAILWTSHDMHEVERVCDRVLFISHGKILLEGHPKELAAAYGKKDLEELFIAVAREPLSLVSN